MAGATGAVIVFDDGKTLKWRDKCEACGNVSSIIHVSSSPSPGTQVHRGMYRCDRCGQSSQITIYG